MLDTVRRVCFSLGFCIVTTSLRIFVPFSLHFNDKQFYPYGTLSLLPVGFWACWLLTVAHRIGLHLLSHIAVTIIIIFNESWQTQLNNSLRH